MNSSQAAMAAARAIVFECLEALLAVLSLLLCLGADTAMIISLWDSQQARMLQEIYPTLADFVLPAFLGIFRLAWCLVFYLWRRRGGLIRLIGQCLLCLYLLIASGFWLWLSAEAISYYETAPFVAAPLFFGLTALTGLALCALPVKSLIQYRIVQKILSKKSLK